MKTRKTKNKPLLETLARVRGLNRKTLMRPRSTVFKDKTKYDRQSHKKETVKQYNDEP